MYVADNDSHYQVDLWQRMMNNQASLLNTGPFFWLMASVFVVALGYGIALPMLPFFLERLLADPGRFPASWHVGMITGVYAFAIVF